MQPVTYTIDAAGRTLGRVASDAAHALLGKRSAHFIKHEVLPITVIITNSKKIVISAKKAKQTIYRHYTGFPGGLREASMEEVMAKKGVSEVIRKTVDGMLPRNKLRKERMKRLKIEA